MYLMIICYPGGLFSAPDRVFALQLAFCLCVESKLGYVNRMLSQTLQEKQFITPT